MDEVFHAAGYFEEVRAFNVNVFYFDFFVLVLVEEHTYGRITIWCFICFSIFRKSSFHICFTIMKTCLYLLLRYVLYPIIQKPIIRE